MTLNKRGKKIYSSIEIEPKFADTGEAYLTGLAVTDDPASLGVEMLKFSAQKTDKKFSSEPLETTLEFSVDEGAEDDDEENTSARRESSGLLRKLLDKFSRLNGRQDGSDKFNTQSAAVLEALGETVEDLHDQVDGLAKQNTAFKKSNKTLRSELDTLRQEFTNFKSQMDSTDADPAVRKPATGANSDAADC